MTTVVYSKKHNVVAFDSRFCIRGDIVTDKGMKAKTVNGVTFVVAGSVGGFDILIDLYFSRKVVDYDMPQCDAIVIDKEKIYLMSIDISDYAISGAEYNIGVGSGSVWALAALDFGLTPKEAVKYAIKKDVYTGGTIRVINTK